MKFGSGDSGAFNKGTPIGAGFAPNGTDRGEVILFGRSPALHDSNRFPELLWR